jgi:hypothetical protein
MPSGLNVIKLLCVNYTLRLFLRLVKLEPCLALNFRLGFDKETTPQGVSKKIFI